MKTTLNTDKAGGAHSAPLAPTRTPAKKMTPPPHTGERTISRKRGQVIRDLDGGLPPYSTIREFAAFAHVHRKTISRDIDDGLLIATEFRGARRISRKDGLAYLRKIRGKVSAAQRRRSRRKIAKTTANLTDRKVP